MLALSAPGECAPVVHRLANGLRVVLVEDHKAPLVAVQVWYQVGSKDERPGLTGASHLLEHMMFQGARRYGPGEFDRQLVRRGGQNNAFTTTDFTAYHEVLASEHLGLALDLEADRMTGALLPADKLESEREVVKEELRGSSDNSPLGAAWDLLPSLTWLAKSYHWPVGGWTSDLDTVSRADLLGHYRSHYHPANAVLVLVGDFKQAEALRSVSAAFGRLPAGPKPPRVRTREPLMRGERQADLLRDVATPVVLAGYRLPAAGSADLPAFQVLARILSHGRSSRLHSEVVEARRLAREVDAGLDEGTEGSLFYVATLPRPGVTPEAARQGCDAVLEGLRRRGPSAAEVARAVKVIEAERLIERETAQGVAEAIGRRVSLHGNADLQAEVSQLRRVTAARVREVARKHLARANRAVITVRPARREDN
ncbi:MAG: pitrilysin family protein [Candidatus Sericytochromatia bacterium]|nr:pitrilysin family protein [Candidatus Sericytochromatia bacterium]